MIRHSVRYELRKFKQGYSIILFIRINHGKDDNGKSIIKRDRKSTGYVLKSPKLWDKRSEQVKDIHLDSVLFYLLYRLIL